MPGWGGGWPPFRDCLEIELENIHCSIVSLRVKVARGRLERAAKTDRASFTDNLHLPKYDRLFNCTGLVWGQSACLLVDWLFSLLFGLSSLEYL